MARVLLVAVAMSGALAGGCSAAGTVHSAAVTQPATAGFSAMGLSFRYPAAWRSHTWSDDVSSFTGSIVDLSTIRLHDPCSVTTRPGRITKVCGYPVGKLPPGAVLVRWIAEGFPPPYRMPKPNTVIAGRPAVETKTIGGACMQLGATQTITVMIPRDANNWYEMNACLRGPGLTQQQAEIAAMLSSVRIARGD